MLILALVVFWTIVSCATLAAIVYLLIVINSNKEVQFSAAVLTVIFLLAWSSWYIQTYAGSRFDFWNNPNTYFKTNSVILENK
jgi:uncharacterized membrane protein